MSTNKPTIHQIVSSDDQRNIKAQPSPLVTTILVNSNATGPTRPPTPPPLPPMLSSSTAVANKNTKLHVNNNLITVSNSSIVNPVALSTGPYRPTSAVYRDDDNDTATTTTTTTTDPLEHDQDRVNTSTLSFRSDSSSTSLSLAASSLVSSSLSISPLSESQQANKKANRYETAPAQMMAANIPITTSNFVGKHRGHHQHRRLNTGKSSHRRHQEDLMHHHMILVQGPEDKINVESAKIMNHHDHQPLYQESNNMKFQHHRHRHQQQLTRPLMTIGMENHNQKLSATYDSPLVRAMHSKEANGGSQMGQRMANVSEYASVLIRDLHYEVGRGRHKKVILDSINLTVPEGSIYGLLGPSGCGKTTMLRCTVGRLKPKRGSLLVFGYKPNDSECQIPGRAVGYMPQEISIYEDFTIEETLRYFGKINRMKSNYIKQRIEFLLSFLDLPNKKRLVANLSGGQKRRVSLAAALVHSPPLLILDEPTVGVDPLLRQSIWQHLVTLTQTEKISVIITTHYIEEASQANVVGLMRHGKILAENSPDQLMATYNLNSLEDVFLRLCVTDSSRRAAAQATNIGSQQRLESPTSPSPTLDPNSKLLGQKSTQRHRKTNAKKGPSNVGGSQIDSPIHIHAGGTFSRRTADNNVADKMIVMGQGQMSAFANDALIRSDEEYEMGSSMMEKEDRFNTGQVEDTTMTVATIQQLPEHPSSVFMTDDYSTGTQLIRWAGRRADPTFRHAAHSAHLATNERVSSSDGAFTQWWKTLMAVTWKNFVRLKRNPPVLIFQFIVPAIQVILFCSCIGGEPFDVPVAIVNDELIPQSSQLFLNGLDRKIVRQVKYNNLSTAIEAVKRGKAWGVIHIPDRYSQNLQSRLILGEEVTNDTISNGTIRVYPDLTNLHLALALETTLRETFINFARDSLENLGYDRSLADLPIQVAKPIYGTMKKDGYLEFMAPGVVISISYVMATGLTALAFILERRDGLLERSLVSGVQTSQILLAHAINQVVVMTIQIFLVLACTFFVFEIPSRGPFVWVVLLILLQGCTGMAFGLLVSAVCEEENTAVMMLVGTFYTNLILAGIIWPIEAMPHWLRPLSYAQPQTLPTETLRHILSRGWGIDEPGVLAGFTVTIGWLVAFLLAAGMIFKYSK